jgi:hypothetical protein
MKKILLLPLTIALCMGSAESMKEDKGDWWVFSLSFAPSEEDARSAYEALNELGLQAAAFWSASLSDEEKGEKLATLFHTIDRPFLRKVLAEALGNESWLIKIAQDSYRNVTGFLKIVLISDEGDGWKLRIHAWDQQGPKEFPHNHKWDFFSKVLSGFLVQDVYDRCELNQGGSWYQVREPLSLLPPLPSGQLQCPCRDHYALREKEIEDVYLKLNTTDRINTGQSYYFLNHLIHTIVPSRGAISFVFTSPKTKENSHVFIPEHRQEEELTRFAPRVSLEELRGELLKIYKELE